MCYTADASPPLPDTGSATGSAATPASRSGPVVLTSADGTRFAGFLARPAGRPDAPGPADRPAARPGVLILPDNRGLRGFYEELAVGLAERGHPALAIDYYGRTAGTGYRDRGTGFGDLATLMPHLRGLTRDGLHADFDAGLDLLRAAGGDRLVSLGFCLGGRFAFLTAADRFGLAGAVGFYGATEPIKGAPGPTQLAAELSAPILGVFGGADTGLPPSIVDAFDQALSAAGVEHQIVTYPGAPHGFFDAAQDGYAEECADAWRRVLAFLDRIGEGRRTGLFQAL